MRFFGYSARILALRTLFAGVLFASAHAVAFERMIVYSEKNVISGLDAAKCATLQDGKFFDSDVTTAFRIDLQAEYRITKIVYAGRPSDQCTQRMRGVQFKGSLDGMNFTTFHAVSQEYDISLTDPEMTTVTLLRDDVRALHRRFRRFRMRPFGFWKATNGFPRRCMSACPFSPDLPRCSLGI